MGYTAYYYRYDPVSRLPKLLTAGEASDYAHFLNSNISNREAYRRQLRNVLLRREFRSFFATSEKETFGNVDELPSAFKSNEPQEIVFILAYGRLSIPLFKYISMLFPCP